MRRRSRYACVPCRQRKRKCDGRLPCSTCTGYGYDCQYRGQSGTDNAHSINGHGNDDYQAEAAPVTTPRWKVTVASPPADPLSSSISPASKKVRLSTDDDTGREEGSSSTPSVRRASSGQHESSSSALPPQQGILEPTKFRYMGRHSAIAFPRWLGLQLQTPTPPRLHSFAYNIGTRKEPGYGVHRRLLDLLSWQEARDLITFYNSTIHPVFGFLDSQTLLHRAQLYWTGTDSSQTPEMEAVIGGVIALASLFSDALSEEREAAIASHAKEVLEDSMVTRFPTIDRIAGWILRTLYIRSTSRPHMAWLYSCNTMHLVEATGLHRKTETVTLTTNDGGNNKRTQEKGGGGVGRNILDNSSSSDIRERTAIVARCLHVIISYEYDRSIVNVIPESHSNIIPRENDYTLQLYNLIRTVPTSDGATRASSTPQMKIDIETRRAELVEALEKLVATHVEHDFLVLTKADLCFCLYRRLRLLDLSVSHLRLQPAIDLGVDALDAARRLVFHTEHQPWWNVVGTVFQCICVFLAIDHPESLLRVPDAMLTLQQITAKFNTHLAREALDTARMLARSSAEKKNKELNILWQIEGVEPRLTNPVDADPCQSNNNAINPEIQLSQQPQHQQLQQPQLHHPSHQQLQQLQYPPQPHNRPPSRMQPPQWATFDITDWNEFLQQPPSLTPFGDVNAWL